MSNKQNLENLKLEEQFFQKIFQTDAVNFNRTLLLMTLMTSREDYVPKTFQTNAPRKRILFSDF